MGPHLRGVGLGGMTGVAQPSYLCFVMLIADHLARILFVFEHGPALPPMLVGMCAAHPT